MNPHLNTIAGRLSLRQPQRDSLEVLARLGDIVPMEKDADVEKALKAIQSEYASVTDFERDFPSVCFALATGVGKTRRGRRWRSSIAISNDWRVRRI
jgi:type III restriction enzyme